MKIILSFVIAGVLVVTGVSLSVAQEGNTIKSVADSAMKPAVSAPDSKAMAQEMGMSEEMMEKMQKFSTPGEEHKVLEQLVGQWETNAKFWMGPDTEPKVSKGRAVTKLIHGGRFIEQTYDSTFMDQPYQGRWFTGFDNQKKQYVSVWIDNMNTGLTTSTSTYDPATKTFTEEGSYSCPLEGGPVKYRGVLKILDDKTYVYEHHMMDKEGKEFKGMEIIYTRD